MRSCEASLFPLPTFFVAAIMTGGEWLSTNRGLNTDRIIESRARALIFKGKRRIQWLDWSRVLEAGVCISLGYKLPQ
jgi:hypothetical protein